MWIHITVQRSDNMAAQFVESKGFVKDDKSIKVPDHKPNDLLIIYRKALKGEERIRHLQGWDNQAFTDRAGNHYLVSWVIDRLGNISEVDNVDDVDRDSPKTYDAFLSIYRGVIVGEISIDDLTHQDPGPFADNTDEDADPDAVGEVHRAPDTTLNAATERVNLLVLPKKHHERITVDFKLKANDGYFTEHGHIALVVRCDLEYVHRAVRGHGLTFGDVAGAPNPGGNPDYAPNQLVPSTQIETWLNYNDLMPERDLYMLNGNPNPPILRDGVEYAVRVESFISKDRTNQTIRYTIHTAGNLLYDSGVVIDPNRVFDATSTSLVIGHVFGPPDSRWYVNLTDIVQRMSD